MFIHPDSFDHNYVEQYPEIFKKYEPIRFQLPEDRMTDFFDSSSFLYGSQKDQDVNMIFSAVQRLYSEFFEDFQSHIKKKEVYMQLAGIDTAKEIKRKIDLICDEYNKQHGMKRKIIEFYQKHVTDDDKALINSKIFKPAWYKSKRGLTREDGFELVIELLLRQRNELDHAARYTPFYSGKQPFTHKIKIQDGKKLVEFTSNLTFQEFYEITRKATAKFWLEEYEKYLQEGGLEMIDELVKGVMEQCERINTS